MNQISYTTARRDVVWLNLYLLTHYRWHRLVFLVCLLAVGWSTVWSVEASLPVRAIVFTCSVLTFGPALLAFVAGFALLSVSRRDRGVLTQHRIELLEEGLIEETPVNRGQSTWAGIYDVRSSRRYILIFISHNSAHVIPKRAFASSSDAETFYRFARSRWEAAQERP